MRRTLNLVLLVGVTFCCAPAQVPDGPYWSSRPTPPNLLSISAFGTTLLMRTTTHLELYSAISKAWVAIPASLGAQTWSFNEYAIVQDGTTVWGYSSVTGAAVSIVTSPAAVITHGPSASSWNSVVKDGTTAYGFGAFSGQWVPTTLASATATVAAGSYTAVVNDGVNLHGFSAYGTSWATTPALSGTTLTVSGSIAFAVSGSTVAAYSAYAQHWTTASFAATAAATVSDSFAIVASSTSQQVLAYSSLRDSFATVNVFAAPITITNGRNVAAIADGTTVHLYAPGTAAFTTIPAPSASLQAAGEFVIVGTGGTLIAFSGLSGTTATPLPGNFTVTTNEDVAFAQGTSTSYAYSVLRNAWFPAPLGGVLSVQLVRDAAILVRGGGYDGFCARTGQWSSLATSVTGTFQTSTQGATFAALDGNAVSVFDSRLGRWATTPTAAAPTVAIWRTTTIAQDGIAAYGFGLTNNVWEAIPLVGPVVQTATNSSLGYVRTSSFLYVYSAHGSFYTESRFAEFSRFQPRGFPLRLVQDALPGSSVTTVVALAGTSNPVAFPAYGTIFLDLGQLLLTLPLGVVPATGLLDLSFPIADDPALSGVTLHLQNIVIEPTGRAFFTNSISPIFI